jgi:hypothetical protein
MQNLNLNYTAIPPAELTPIILVCPSLCVLKAASLPDFVSLQNPIISRVDDSQTDNAMHKIVVALEAAAGLEPIFPALKSLKLKRTSISESHLINFLKCFPSLETLDLSFTSVRNIPFRKIPASELSLPPLSKLILTSTQLHPGDVCAVLPQLPKLRKLHLGALPTFSDSHLLQLTKLLFDHCPEVEEINLVRNTRLGDGIGAYNAFPEFIRRIGRKCRVLFSICLCRYGYITKPYSSILTSRLLLSLHMLSKVFFPVHSQKRSLTNWLIPSWFLTQPLYSAILT